jgi:hypothetical protein
MATYVTVDWSAGRTWKNNEWYTKPPKLLCNFCTTWIENMAAGRMRPAGWEMVSYGLYFILAYGGFSHSSYSQHTLSACLLWPAQHVKARTHDVFMMTVNENKLPKLYIFFFNIRNLKKKNFQTRLCQVLSFVTCQVSRKTTCLMHLISASFNARKQMT